VLNYRHTCINHLLSSLRKDEKAISVSFIAMGEMALALKSHINPYLEQIMAMVRQILVSKRPGYIEAMQCVSMLSQAVGPALSQYLGDILGLMFDTGLSTSLTDCLTELVRFTPSFLPMIQERLLDLLSLVLSGKPYYHSGTPASFRKKKASPQFMDSRKSALALNTLGSFDFSSHVLTELVCESVVPYLDDEQP
jgi:serine/threonine-protein kinase mTOR